MKHLNFVEYIVSNFNTCLYGIIGSWLQKFRVRSFSTTHSGKGFIGLGLTMILVSDPDPDHPKGKVPLQIYLMDSIFLILWWRWCFQSIFTLFCESLFVRDRRRLQTIKASLAKRICFDLFTKKQPVRITEEIRLQYIFWITADVHKPSQRPSCPATRHTRSAISLDNKG